MSTKRPGAVFDAMVFLQAMVSDQGPAFACQQLVDNGKLTLFISPVVLEEVKDIANRPRVRQKFKNLTPEKVQAFLEDLDAIAVPMKDVPHTFNYLRDPDDEPYINLAIAAGAKYLVSWDKDLLDLMHDEDFRAGFPNLMILNPVGLLAEFSPNRREASSEKTSG